jgi:PEP-CTERM motif-containing protein
MRSPSFLPIIYSRLRGIIARCAPVRVLTLTLIVVAAFISNTPALASLISSGLDVNAREFTSLNNVPVQAFADTNLGDTAVDFGSVINWGDGSTSFGTVSGGSGAFSVAGTHTYADEGSFTITVTTTQTVSNDITNSTSTGTLSEADVVSGTGNNILFTMGVPLSNVLLATFTDSPPDNVAGDFSSTINWGDATSTAGIVTGGGGLYQVFGTHTYASAGPFTTSVSLVDDAPGTAFATATGTAGSNSVPEPSSAMLLSAGLALLGLVVWRARSTSVRE